MIFDTHAHYDDEQFDNDREALLASLFAHKECGGGSAAMDAGRIGAVVDVGSTPESLAKVMAIARLHDSVYAAVGIHPDEVGAITDEVVREIKEDLTDPKTIAVGEIGLDYYWNKEEHDIQEHWFRRQIELAFEYDKPIIVHSRAAAEDTMRVIKDYYGPAAGRTACAAAASAAQETVGDQETIDTVAKQSSRPGIIHCYAYSVEMAREYVAMGFMLGIGGVVTYKNGRKLKEVVQAIPLEYLVLETDCPYLSPEPNRGRRNSSLNLPYVVKAIAELKGVTEQEVEEVTWQNACKVFRLEPGK